MVEGLVEAEQGRLLAAVFLVGGREAGRRLVGQFLRLPRGGRGVEKLAQLGADVPETGRRAEGVPVGPPEVVQGGDRDVGSGVEVGSPLRLGIDDVLRRQLCHPAQADLRAGVRGAVENACASRCTVPVGVVLGDCGSVGPVLATAVGVPMQAWSKSVRPYLGG